MRSVTLVEVSTLFPWLPPDISRPGMQTRQDAAFMPEGADDFLLVDYVLAVDHLEEHKLSTQRQHSLFPVFRVPLALLIYPIIGSHFACKRFAISIESPHGCLSALAKFLLENVEFSREFTRLDRFRFIAAGVLLFFDH